MVLKEQMAYMYGEEFCGLLAEKIEEANHKRSTSMRSHLWGHHKRNDVFYGFWLCCYFGIKSKWRILKTH